MAQDPKQSLTLKSRFANLVFPKLTSCCNGVILFIHLEMPPIQFKRVKNDIWFEHPASSDCLLARLCFAVKVTEMALWS